jgi:hypothetical protein
MADKGRKEMAQFILFHNFLPPNANFSNKNSKDLHVLLRALRESSLNKILREFPMIKKIEVDSTMSYVELPDEKEHQDFLIEALVKRSGCVLFEVEV